PRAGAGAPGGSRRSHRHRARSSVCAAPVGRRGRRPGPAVDLMGDPGQAAHTLVGLLPDGARAAA
ncbi:hypothetical protein NGM33_06215, partial [Nocardiopsis dassonvillei]|nr:hypothetical protein [Nocardiopsis dassonvillei]